MYVQAVVVAGVLAVNGHGLLGLVKLVIADQVAGGDRIQVTVGEVELARLIVEDGGFLRITSTLVDLGLQHIEVHNGGGVLDCLIYILEGLPVVALEIEVLRHKEHDPQMNGRVLLILLTLKGHLLLE